VLVLWIKTTFFVPIFPGKLDEELPSLFPRLFFSLASLDYAPRPILYGLCRPSLFWSHRFCFPGFFVDRPFPEHLVRCLSSLDRHSPSVCNQFPPPLRRVFPPPRDLSQAQVFSFGSLEVCGRLYPQPIPSSTFFQDLPLSFLADREAEEPVTSAAYTTSLCFQSPTSFY